MKNKILKFGVGLALGAVAGAGFYYTYQKNEDNLRVELVDAIRDYFSDEELEVVWLFDQPVRNGVFSGGFNTADGRSVAFEIEEKSHKVIKEEEVE